jgi:hypothetical protein
MLFDMKILLVALLVQAVNMVVFVHFHRTAVAQILALRHQLCVLLGQPKSAVWVLGNESRVVNKLRRPQTRTG